MATSLAQLNAAGADLFVATVGPVFEGSGWIAVSAWERRPFADRDALHAALMKIVNDSPEASRLALIAAHPDLAGQLARGGGLTPASAGEQTAAGLYRLSPRQAERFDDLNSAYRARFGFPFVICAREQSADSILSALELRTKNSREAEIAAALHEIEKIARLRLADAVSE